MTEIDRLRHQVVLGDRNQRETLRRLAEEVSALDMVRFAIIGGPLGVSAVQTDTASCVSGLLNQRRPPLSQTVIFFLSQPAWRWREEF